MNKIMEQAIAIKDDIVDYKDYERKVVIGDIYVDNNRVTFDGDKLVLEHDDKNLSIEYFLPNYENLRNNHF